MKGSTLYPVSVPILGASKFNKNGNVMSGPAPRNLPWLEMSRHVDGNLVVDASREIQTGTKFKV
jgi:hypothetical protein